MSLSSVLLAIFVFLVSTVTYLAWFSVDNKLIGWVGVIFVIVRAIEAFRPLTIPMPTRARSVE